jgi:transcription antitermination factor NusG
MDTRQQLWPWYAILSKTGRERSATQILENIGYECYLPVSRSARRWSDRTKIIDVALFPGYFFCRMNQRNRLPVLMTPGVINVVGVGKTPIPVDEDEIAAIQQVGASSLAVTPWPYVGVGQMVRIEAGPLQGLTGIVIKVKSGTKLVLSVSLLQRSVAVEIDRTWVGEAAAPGRAANRVH